VLVARALAEHPAWVRVNAVRSDLCAVDLDAVAGRALGIKLPKPEAAADVQWIADRAPGTPIVCAIDTARGVLAAQEIAPVRISGSPPLCRASFPRSLRTVRGEVSLGFS
jgi:citrate lyase subunit beta/citryl-CoA lyase